MSARLNEPARSAAFSSLASWSSAASPTSASAWTGKLRVEQVEAGVRPVGDPERDVGNQRHGVGVPLSVRDFGEALVVHQAQARIPLEGPASCESPPLPTGVIRPTVNQVYAADCRRSMIVRTSSILSPAMRSTGLSPSRSPCGLNSQTRASSGRIHLAELASQPLQPEKPGRGYSAGAWIGRSANAKRSVG